MNLGAQGTALEKCMVMGKGLKKCGITTFHIHAAEMESVVRMESSCPHCSSSQGQSMLMEQ